MVVSAWSSVGRPALAGEKMAGENCNDRPTLQALGDPMTRCRARVFTASAIVADSPKRSLALHDLLLYNSIS
jgi:hypothetical protein